MSDTTVRTAHPDVWVVVFADVGQHRVDVFEVEWPSPWQAEVNLLKAEALHVIQQFLLLLDGWIQRGGALQAVTQGLVVKPNLVRMTAGIA